MTELSLQAQAVLDAAINAAESPDAEAIAAAVLRAAADQVVPHMKEPDWFPSAHMQCDMELYTDHQRKRAAFLAIATELEEHQ